MHSIDKVGYGDYLLDPGRKIPDAHLKAVCKSGCSNKACRYITLTTNGFACTKNTPLKEKIDLMVDMAKQGHVKFTARGNNCEGLGIYGETTKESV